MLFWSFLTIFTFGGNIILGLNVRLKEINGFRIIQATIKVVALFLMIGYFGLYAVPISFILSMSALLYLWRIFHKEFQISYKKLLRLTMSILMISSTIYLTYYLSFELSSIFRITLGLSHLAILLTMLWHKKIILIINDLKS
jgi:O-antigen/teichoic acid export membrane protein